jgi:hypothetical protein
MLAVLSETLDVALEFQLSMTVTTYRSLEMFVELLSNGMLHLKTKDVPFWAVETPGGIAHLLAA